MGARVTKSFVLGGLVAFIWMMISWMAFSWHCWTMHGFQNESAVAQVIMNNAPKSGVYMLPDFCGVTGDLFLQKQQAMKQGPLVFASVSREGFDFTSPWHYIASIVIQLVGALFISWILWHFRNHTYWKKVWTVVLIALIAGILAFLPAWNWWGFSFGYVLTEIIDLVIAWFLAGLVMAWAMKPDYVDERV